MAAGHVAGSAPTDLVREQVALILSLDVDLTQFENLVLLGLLLGLGRSRSRARANELLNAFGLAAAAGCPLKTSSGGMQRRLDVATSIIVTPELLFLDEPTTGLDHLPHLVATDRIVRALPSAGSTVLLTTQYLEC